MTKHKRVEMLLEHMAHWAFDYRGSESHDTDIIVSIGGIEVTVGMLRRAFERHYMVPFRTYQLAANDDYIKEVSGNG